MLAFDRRIVFDIENAALRYFTDFDSEWRPPSDYLESPIQKMPWMEYGPSILFYRDYEPINSILYHGGVFLILYYAGPILLEGARWYINRGASDDGAGSNSSGLGGGESDDEDKPGGRGYGGEMLPRPSRGRNTGYTGDDSKSSYAGDESDDDG